VDLSYDDRRDFSRQGLFPSALASEERAVNLPKEGVSLASFNRGHDEVLKGTSTSEMSLHRLRNRHCNRDAQLDPSTWCKQRTHGINAELQKPYQSISQCLESVATIRCILL